MHTQEVGQLLKRLRKQRKVTQLALSLSTGVDQATISKIENGHAMPSRGTVELIFGKLGLDINKIPMFLLSAEEAEHQRFRDKLDKSVWADRFDETRALLKEAAQNKHFMSVASNRQSLLMLTANLTLKEHTAAGKPQDEAVTNEMMKLLQKAILETIPVFKEENISQYHLEGVEISVLILMAQCYRNKAVNYFINDNVSLVDKDAYDRGLRILRGVEVYFAEYCFNSDTKKQSHGKILHAIASFLQLGCFYKESLEACEKALDLFRESEFYVGMAAILFVKSNNLKHLGRMEECTETLKALYYVRKLLNYPAHMLEEIKDTAKVWELEVNFKI
ncbi:MAG: helix-turn-helix domain-containing protein [Defluviitaleaceae bacterium]|nr:helix-turn-helix domain-containing protein [Defluviitaleaceae bacterium]